MTTSLRRLGSCIDVTGTLSVRDHLVPAAVLGSPLSGRPGLGSISGPISVLAVMRRVEWTRCGGANYLKVAAPVELRSPSREEAQVMVSGIASRVKLFMGRSDWELDWHVYLDLEEDVKTMLRRAGPLPSSGLYCELMGIDRWEDEIFGRQWWSSDFDGAFSLRWPLPNGRSGAETASEHWSLVADDDQGTNTPVADGSDPGSRTNAAIVGARVYLQGPLVNDNPTDTEDHNLLEIHPLDSIAYAKDATRAVPHGQTDGPDLAGFDRPVAGGGDDQRRLPPHQLLRLPAQGADDHVVPRSSVGREPAGHVHLRH